MKRLLISMPEEVHLKLRIMAFRRNVSMSAYVLDALLLKLLKEVDYETITDEFVRQEPK